MADRGKGGRPSKGPRKRLDVRVPIPLAEAVRRAADLDGLDVNTWVTETLAERLNYPLPGQERLPLTKITA